MKSRHVGIGMCADFMQDYLRIWGLLLTAYFLEMRNRHLLTGLTYIFYTPSRCVQIFKKYSTGTSGPRGSRSPTASSSACASRVLKSALTRAEAIVAAAYAHNTHTHTHKSAQSLLPNTARALESVCPHGLQEHPRGHPSPHILSVPSTPSNLTTVTDSISSLKGPAVFGPAVSARAHSTKREGGKETAPREWEGGREG